MISRLERRKIPPSNLFARQEYAILNVIMPRLPKKVKSVPYTVRVLIGDRVYNSSASTIPEAFEKMELGKLVLVGKVFITISHGERKHEFFLPPVGARKLCLNKNYQLIFEKRAKQFLGELVN